MFVPNTMPGGCPSSETDHLALHPLGRCQARHRMTKREGARGEPWGNLDACGPQMSTTFDNLEHNTNYPYLQKYAGVFMHRCAFKLHHSLADVMVQPSRYASLLFHLPQPTVSQRLQVDAEPEACCPLSVWVEVVQGEQ